VTYQNVEATQRLFSAVRPPDLVLPEIRPRVGAPPAAPEQMNLGARSDSRTSSDYRPPLIATWWLTRQKYRTHRKSGRKSPFCCPLWPEISLIPRGRLSQGGSHHGIHQLHSDQHANARIEPALVTGNDLAFVQGHRTETHNHRSACARKSLAASRRPSLAI
jgi:hypothetical protein